MYHDTGRRKELSLAVLRCEPKVKGGGADMNGNRNGPLLVKVGHVNPKSIQKNQITIERRIDCRETDRHEYQVDLNQTQATHLVQGSSRDTNVVMQYTLYPICSMFQSWPPKRRTMALFAHQHIVIRQGRTSVRGKVCRYVEFSFVLSLPFSFLVEGHRPRNFDPTQRLLG